MGVFEEYRALYEKYIVDKAKVVILRYDPVKHRYEYKPYSHTVSYDAIDKLAELIINNMVFYAFSEDEVVEQNKKFGLLNDLFAAARYAYAQRLPKRKNADTDGTVGEVLLDILIPDLARVGYYSAFFVKPSRFSPGGFIKREFWQVQQ